MLVDLRVRDLGVIEDLTLRFGPGMTALTGETGAGKTLVVEALHLVLGGRGGTGLVRSGRPEAVVEAAFVEEGPGGTEHELVLGRSVPATGRSRAFVDGRMVPLATLAEAASGLVDIHGQHEHQSLLAPAAQRRALDVFAGADTAGLRQARQALAAVERELASLGGDEHQRARDADILRYQLDEITRVGVTDPDEELALVAEEERLADLGAHRAAAEEALRQLEDAGGSLAAAARLLGDRATFEPWAGRLAPLVAETADVASDLRSATYEWEEDPARLEEVQGRRRQLADLRRKYGATLADVLAFAAETGDRLDALSSVAERAEALAAERERCRAEVADQEEALRQVRAAAAPAMAAAVTARLADLAMAGARVEVSVAGTGSGEPVRFGLGANPGEPVQPLAKVASGGELARTMLALRLEAGGGPAVMVFDEVDAGVGGAAALALGRALREVATHHQVLVVTHLAQVAAFADHQVVVTKEVRDGRTVTGASVLDPESRVVELSRMLSGHPDSETARAHAAELLALGAGAHR